MKKMKSVALLFILFSGFTVFSQSKVFENVVKVEVKNSVAITNNKQIVGYAIFYQIDKMKKAAMYRLSIVDENLKEIGSNEFEGAKNLFLVRAVYESDQLLLSFFDDEKKAEFERFVKIFDLKGKETGNIPYDPDKVKKGMFGAAIAASMESIYNGTDNVEGKGFVVVYQSKAKTGGVDIQMIGTNGKLKWEKNITADKGNRTDLYLLGTTPNTILFFEMDRSGVMSKDADVFMVGLNSENGTERFKKPMDIKGTTYEPMLIKKSSDDKLKVVSTLYNTDAKFLSGKPIGFSIGDLDDLTGDIKIIKDFNYLNDLSDILSMKNESKSDDGYIKAHNILIMQDGSLVLVGEFFRKTVSGLGMAMKILSRGQGSASQATIEDMFLLRIDNKLKPQSLEKIEKEKERVPLPTDGLPIGLLARLLTYAHVFGYMYTDEGLDGKKKTILAKGTFGEEKYGAVAITVDDKKGFTTKRFSLEKEKYISYYVLPGKPGYVMIMKYNSKEKTISVNLEKVN